MRLKTKGSEHLSQQNTVFISYSREDEKWKELLVKHLQVGDQLDIWDDSQVDAGEEWRTKIEEAITRARVAILVVSADFLGSRFVQGIEVSAVLRKRAEDGMRVVPLLARSCAWESVDWLESLQIWHPQALANVPRPQAEGLLAKLAREVQSMFGSTSVGEWSRARAEGMRATADTEGTIHQTPRVCHNLPDYSMKHLFKGRDADLEWLAHSCASTAQVVICGIGGIGKTQLALEYAWRSADRFDFVLWVDAGSPETFTANFSALADPDVLDLNLAADININLQFKKVAGWLSNHRNWLLIFDDIRDLHVANNAKRYLPRFAGQGVVIITSRWDEWSIPILRLHELEAPAAKEFIVDSVELQQDPVGDHDRVLKVVEILKGHPLTLKLAATYVNRNILALDDDPSEWRRFVRSPALAALSLWQLDAVGKLGQAVLRVAAFINEKDIPLALFELNKDILCEISAVHEVRELKKFDVREAVADLVSWSLLDWPTRGKKDGKYFDIHPVVQEWIRSGVREDKELLVSYVARLLLRSFSEDTGVRLRAHGDRLLDHADSAKIMSKEVMELVGAMRGSRRASPPIQRHEQERKSRRDISVSQSDELFPDVDCNKLSRVGWGVIFSPEEEERAAGYLSKLLEFRRSQARNLYHREIFPEVWGRHYLWAFKGESPGTINPESLPYYVLLVGSPEQIPFEFQYELAINRAVGRLYFEDPKGYASYTDAVIEAEVGNIDISRNIGLISVNSDDHVGHLIDEFLMRPLKERILRQFPGWSINSQEEFSDGKCELKNLLCKRPGLLLTATHGKRLPFGDPRQVACQGSLVCRDGVLDAGYLADLQPEDKPLHGVIAWLLNCYSAGTPVLDSFPESGQEAAVIAEQEFIAALPQAMLARGALAVLGRVDRGWTSSFRWLYKDRKIDANRSLENALVRLLGGHRLGHALRPLARRLSSIATHLFPLYEDHTNGRRRVDEHELQRLRIAYYDARNYILIGDPAVYACGRPPSESRTHRRRSTDL